MIKKVGFPRVTACKTIIDVRHLLSKVRWKSAEYRVLMLRWRELCRDMALVLITGRRFRTSKQNAEVWRKLYDSCPAGSSEETVALGIWQSCMPHDEGLGAYRQRVISEATQAAHTFRFQF